MSFENMRFVCQIFNDILLILSVGEGKNSWRRSSEAADAEHAKRAKLTANTVFLKVLSN
jgi:hypothetical protein